MQDCSMCFSLSMLCIFFSLMYLIQSVSRIKERQKYKQMIYDLETQIYNNGLEIEVDV